MDIKKGQQIWIWVDNHSGEKVIETTVKSIGSKYITTSYGIKYYVDTLREVDSRGHASFIIHNIIEYRRNQVIREKIRKIERLNWHNVEEEDIEKVFDIIKDYE